MVNFQSQNEQIDKYKKVIDKMEPKVIKNDKYIETRIEFNREQWEKLVKLENKKLDIEKWNEEKEKLINFINQEIEKKKCNEYCIGCIRIPKKIEEDFRKIIKESRNKEKNK